MAVRTVEVVETYKVPDFASNVARGVALLDKKAPGWAKKVDLKELDLSNGDRCVVGQLAIKSMLNGPLEGYTEGVEKLFGSHDSARDEKHGFYLTEKTVQEVYDWLLKQPPTHPWFAIVGPASSGEGWGTWRDLKPALWDFLTALWVQVVKARQKPIPKKTTVKKTVPAKKTAAKKTETVKKTAAKKTTARR